MREADEQGAPVTVWRERRARAVHLMASRPHAEELLGFYVGVLEAQESVGEWLRSAGARHPPKESRDGQSTAFELWVRDFASDRLVARFRAFVADLSPLGPEPVAALGQQTLRSAPDALRAQLLDVAGPAGRDPGDTAGFFAEAFVQPLAVWARSTSDGSTDSAMDLRPDCAFCGDRPITAILRDDPEKKGRRLLGCGRCGATWPYLRVGCVACAETDSDALTHHVDDAAPHLRVDECRSCRRYLKTVDLRRTGDAVPMVDDIASPELDLWAGERGFQKVRLNLMGL